MAAACYSSMTTAYFRPQEEVSPVSSHIQNTSNKISTARRNMKPLTTSTVYPRRLFVKASSSSSSDPVMVKKHNSFPSKAATPWLMLTPEMKPSSGVFKFYSLAEDKVITIEQKNLKGQLGLESKKVDLVFKGSSHGWLVVFDRLSCDLFLYNPRTNCHLTLPTIRNLEAISEYDLESGDCVTKVIISSSNPATDPNCRALMIYGFDDHLAFCCPSGGGSEWIETHHCSYDDVVHYGGNSTIFFGVNVEAYPEFHAWDLKDISRPKLISLEDRLVKDFGETFPWKGYDFRKLEEANFLVAHCGDEQQLFYVGLDLKNMDFHVHKFDFENGKLVCMDRSLDGLAFFIGRNHSFALSATDELPQLKANSIYFANPEEDELGKIYNYEDGTFSPAPIYTVKDSSGHASPPMWFDII